MRRAVDTNILVRLFARDDSEQWERVGRLLRVGSIAVGSTVLLEVEWVLRSVLGYDRVLIQRLFADLLSLPNVEFIEEQRVIAAVGLHGSGMDFADALHLTGAAASDEFVTFDRNLARLAKKTNWPVPVKLL